MTRAEQDWSIECTVTVITATSSRDVPNDPGVNDRSAARTVSVEAPMLQPSMGLDPDRFSLLKKPLR